MCSVYTYNRQAGLSCQCAVFVQGRSGEPFDYASFDYAQDRQDRRRVTRQLAPNAGKEAQRVHCVSLSERNASLSRRC